MFPMHRRSFLTAAAVALVSARSIAQTAATAPIPPVAPPSPAQPARGGPLDLALVKEFVVAGHTDIPRVRAMLAVHPSLINASWDWGSGDFECALNGASHLGRRDVALFLLESGARLDAPCAALLGETDIIRALLRLSPTAANTRGAHGFPLLYHAAYGGHLAIADALHPHLKEPARDCNLSLLPATLAGQTEFVAWLLTHGADNPNPKNFQGKTPLDLATERKYPDIVKLLRDAGGVTTR